MSYGQPQPGYGGGPQPGGYGGPQPGYPHQQQQGGYPQQQQGGYQPPQGRPNMAPQYQQQGAPPNPNLMQWFQSVDTNRSGTIEAKEVVQVMRMSGIMISEHSAAKAVSMFDRDGNGTITFDEFSQLHLFLQAMSTGFRTRDRSGDGRLDGNEVRAALNERGYRFDEQTLQSMMRKFDNGRKGYHSFDDYLCLSIFLSNAKNTFDFNDRNRSGQATFNFEGFVNACVNCK